MVSEPGNVYEREADHVAETVMRMPQTAEDERSSGEMPHLLRASDAPASAPEAGGDLESSVLAQATGGQPLPSSARAFFEPRLNSDLGNVRIHADSQAAESAHLVGARAYTLGNHIVFGNAEYAPAATPVASCWLTNWFTSFSKAAPPRQSSARQPSPRLTQLRPPPPNRSRLPPIG